MISVIYSDCPMAASYPNTSLHFTPLHFTSLHYTPLHFTSPHFTSPHSSNTRRAATPPHMNVTKPAGPSTASQVFRESVKAGSCRRDAKPPYFRSLQTCSIPIRRAISKHIGSAASQCTSRIKSGANLLPLQPGRFSSRIARGAWRCLQR